MPIQVIGPVIRPTTLQPGWVSACYKLIEDFARSNPQYQARLPIVESALEKMEAGQFLAEMTRRIKTADHVIAIFLPEDQSIPVECALATHLGKRVLLVHEFGAKIPRILAGLPLITATAFGPNTSRSIQIFLMR